ncbi:MAG: alpha/beta fold hydrolase, partial [Candidatus Hermodarchaeota archaeon]
FGQLTNLKELSLWGNQLRSLPESFGQLTKLQTLDLSSNKLSSLPESFGQLTKLNWLLLKKNQLQELPSSFIRLKKLKILDLRYNEFEILLNSFGELEQLEDLRLLENKLNSFPDSFKGLTRLKYLDLGQNNFTNIPEAIENLTSLEVITVHGNQITSLSEDLCRCKNLQVMSIAKNPLTNLPENFGDLMLLNELNLHGTELSSLPESFGQLTKLTDLDLGENQLVSLPESFGQLTNLKELSLWGNQLRSLPESFGPLTKLQTLDLSSNKLSSLPESFGQLTSLEDLNLEQNQLRDFPKTFWNLKILKKFKWQNNPVDSEETQKKVEDSFSLLRERSKLSDLSFRAVQIGNFDVYIRDSLTKGPLLIFVVLFGAISKVWDDFFKFFSQKYRTVIYALDQQGKTGAPRQKALYQCDAYVKHLEDVIQSLGASQAKDRVTLIGYSFGGCVALDYALKHANQVERLVLISSVARFSHNFRDAGQYILEENSWEHPKKRLFDLNSQSDVATMFFGDKADPEIIRELKKLMQETPDYVLKAIVESIILKFDVISQLKDLSVPTLLLRGKQDDMICPKEAFDELKKIPIKNVVEIDQATHGVLFEGLQVLDQIQTFLNKDISRDN